jgi:hypothetical protein
MLFSITVLFSIPLLQTNNLSLVVLFLGLGCCFNSYLTHSTCQTLSLNKNNESAGGEEEGNNNHLMIMNQTNIDDVTISKI